MERATHILIEVLACLPMVVAITLQAVDQVVDAGGDRPLCSSARSLGQILCNKLADVDQEGVHTQDWDLRVHLGKRAKYVSDLTLLKATLSYATRRQQPFWLLNCLRRPQ